jgi:hypothetical protein
MAKAAGKARHVEDADTAEGKADWEAIRADYISCRDSLEVVGERQGVSRASMGRHSREGGWVLARETWQRGLNDKRLARLQQIRARSEAEIDRVFHQALWAGVGALLEALARAKTPERVKAILHTLEKSYPAMRMTAGLAPQRLTAPPGEGPEPVLAGVDATGHPYLETPEGARFRPADEQEQPAA